jgi:hypothetical protein
MRVVAQIVVPHQLVTKQSLVMLTRKLLLPERYRQQEFPQLGDKAPALSPAFQARGAPLDRQQAQIPVSISAYARRAFLEEN